MTKRPLAAKTCLSFGIVCVYVWENACRKKYLCEPISCIKGLTAIDRNATHTHTYMRFYITYFIVFI